MPKEIKTQDFQVNLDGVIVKGTRRFWVERTGLCPPSAIEESLDIDEVELADEPEDTPMTAYFKRHGEEECRWMIEKLNGDDVLERILWQ